MRPEVLLTDEQVARAVAEGNARHQRRVAAGSKPTYGQSQQHAASAHPLGAQAELAFAVWLGVEWTPGPEPDRSIGDVAGIQIRSTDHQDGHLPVHPNDPDDWRLVLVTVASPLCRIIGWLYAHEGKCQEWWWTSIRHPCFMVPQDALRPVRRREREAA